jgi:hypothetical protein
MAPHTAALEGLTVNGRHVIPARAAAIRSGWSQNYIGILCRTGEFAGVRLTVGWFVDAAALEVFMQERARRKNEQLEKLRDLRREEYARGQEAASLA